MTRQQEREARMPNRFLKSDKRFFVPFTPARGRGPVEPTQCVVEVHSPNDLRLYLSVNHPTDDTSFSAFYRHKYSELLKRVALTGRTPIKQFYRTCAEELASSTETTEVQAAALEIARTRVTLQFSDELYGKQKMETGLSSAQQFLAFKQAQREQQSK